MYVHLGGYSVTVRQSCQSRSCVKAFQQAADEKEQGQRELLLQTIRYGFKSTVTSMALKPWHLVDAPTLSA